MPTARSSSVPPFYGICDPHPMPLLSSQTQMCYQSTTQVAPISAMVEMSTVGPLVTAPLMAPVFRKAKRASTPIHAGSPKSVSFHPDVVLVGQDEEVRRSRRSADSPALSESTLTSLESESESESDDDDDRRSKIPKPNGEAGRPGRGGYNLEETLGWDDTTFQELKRFIHRAVKKNLDETKCRSLQDRGAMDGVVKKTLARFPELADFQCSWPVYDIIQLRLKYTSSRSRQKRIASPCPAK